MGAVSTPAVTFRDVEVSYGVGESAHVAVRGVTLDCAPGSFTALVGGNGCGKTSLIRAAAGLLPVSSGAVEHDGTPITAPSPRRWLIQQGSNLLPWHTVQGNLDFARRAARSSDGLDPAEALQVVGLGSAAHLRPGQLSGGMVQRAELARALVVGPAVLLLDEPFGAVDALSRLKLQRELRRITAHWRATSLMVTHDISEAVFLADQVVVIGGRPGTVLGVLPTWEGARADDDWRARPEFRDTCARIEEMLAADDAAVSAAHRPATTAEPRSWWRSVVDAARSGS